MKTTNEIIDILRAYKPEAAAKYGITKLGLFGSCARGQQHEGSDVDVCFDMQVPSLITMARIIIELEKLLGCSVDLVRERPDMNELLKDNIRRDAIYV